MDQEQGIQGRTKRITPSCLLSRQIEEDFFPVTTEAGGTVWRYLPWRTAGGRVCIGVDPAFGRDRSVEVLYG